MKSFFLSAASMLPILAMAHPGHGETDGFSIIHYFTEPIHAVITVGAIVAFYAGIRYFRHKKQNN